MKIIDRRRGWGSGLGLASALLTGCYRGGTPPILCEGAACQLSSSSGSSSGEPATSTTAVPTTGEPSTGEPSTGEPSDDSITFRLDSLTFIDPHLFLTQGDPAICVNDVTGFVNVALNDDAMSGQFNLLARFEDFEGVNEMRLVDADCEEPAVAGGRRLCTPSIKTQAVLLTTAKVDVGGCRELDPAHHQAITLPDIHDPQAPCVRSNQVDFSIPVSASVGALNLRDAQFAARLDAAVDPQRLEDGLLTGFLTKAVAEDLNFQNDMIGTINLWSLIDSPACIEGYPDYLPSVDEFLINDLPVTGVWLAINFTAERVDYVSP
ncbi:MAG: hypothetical protein H0T76_28275 [Nannocystis sp.]|nr:hypothetical protein [Nannocystis sp.]MBA3550390.1 hypothetical protein [Nannocystis sp.]